MAATERFHDRREEVVEITPGGDVRPTGRVEPKREGRLKPREHRQCERMNSVAVGGQAKLRGMVSAPSSRPEAGTATRR